MSEFSVNALDCLSKQSIANLDAVQAASLQELQAVTSSLYGFLTALDSQSEDWLKLKNRLNQEAPYFLKKVQVAFVYYFAKCLEKAYISTDAVIRAPKDLQTSLRSFGRYLTGAGNTAFRYFTYLLEGRAPNTSIEGNSIASVFIEDLFMLKASGENAVIKNVDFEPDINTLNLEDFFRFNKQKIKQINAAETPKEFTDALRTYANTAKSNEKPEIKLIGIVLDRILIAIIDHVDFRVDISEDSDAKRYLGKVKDKDLKKQYKEFIEKYNGSNFEDIEKYKELSADFSNTFFLATKIANENNTEEISESVNQDPELAEELEGLRAINATNYIMGRISAEEFQAKDAEICSRFEIDINCELPDRTKAKLKQN